MRMSRYNSYTLWCTVYIRIFCKSSIDTFWVLLTFEVPPILRALSFGLYLCLHKLWCFEPYDFVKIRAIRFVSWLTIYIMTVTIWNILYLPQETGHDHVAAIHTLALFLMLMDLDCSNSIGFYAVLCRIKNNVVYTLVGYVRYLTRDCVCYTS